MNQIQEARSTKYFKEKRAELHPRCEECGEFRQQWGCVHCMTLAGFVWEWIKWDAKKKFRSWQSRRRICTNCEKLFSRKAGL